MISIKVENQTSVAANLVGILRGPELTLAGARGVAQLLRDHFTQLDSSHPNRRGWHRLHFWNEVAGTVHDPLLSGDHATIQISHVAIAQKIHGGPIYPRNAHYLTIPATNEAYGKRARDFSDLKFGYAWDDELFCERRALVRKDTPERKPLFWLVSKVRQAPTPGTIPSEEHMESACAGAMNEWLTNRTEN